MEKLAYGIEQREFKRNQFVCK